MALDAETLDQLLVTVRRFVDERLRPIEDQVSENDAVPDSIVNEMKELGLFGISVPVEYGGLGLTMEEECRVMLELGRTSPAFRSVIGTNVGIGSQGIVMHGRQDQKEEWLPKIASGEVIISFALTEPEAGSDAASLKTTAIRDGDHYIVNGTKRFITNAHKAHAFTLLARTDPKTPGAKGVSAFIVSRDTPGLTLGKNEKKMGQQGAHICDVIFDNARIHKSCLLGETEGKGFITAMQVLERGRLHISAVCMGVADRLVADSTKYAAERKQFGAPIVQAMLADSRMELYAGRCMVIDAAKRRDAGEDVATESSCCKLFCSEAVGRIADRAVQIHGGAGYVADYGIERFYRDVRIFRLYEGTSQVQQVIIARNMLKEVSQ